MSKNIPNSHQKKHEATVKQRKSYKRRNKSDLGPDFVAPDGGWAWIVCLASGFSTFCVFTPVQQYGIIYRQRMYGLGFDAKQITSIINSELATAAVTGIINGALFRRFTFRQTALVGGFMVFLGTLLTAYCTSFWQYLFCFSCLYGIGLGMNLSAMALAVNTYFKEYRRRATGFASTITGLGPIILPHVCTWLLQVFGTQGTILLIAAFSLNTLACSLTLQPVMWHVKNKKKSAEIKKLQNLNEAKEVQIKKLCQNCQEQQQQQQSKWNIFGTDNSLTDVEQNESDDSEREGMLRNATLASFSEDWLSSMESIELELKKSNKLLRRKSFKCNLNLNEVDSNLNLEVTSVKKKHCNCSSLKNSAENVKAEKCDDTKKLTFIQKVIKFFDLDLLTDLTFVNLVQGMTIMMFCELNFSFLTPFILASYGYDNSKISLAMSLLAGVDIVVRFGAPFVVEKMKLSNTVLFAFGIVVLLLGRVFVTLTNSFHFMLAIFMFMGFGKGFRTIFGPLILPSYVPLNRLAAASGLQLFLNAIFTTAFGPVLGLIADLSNYTFTIHFMNLLTLISISFWFIEWFVRRLLKSNEQNEIT